MLPNETHLLAERPHRDLENRHRAEQAFGVLVREGCLLDEMISEALLLEHWDEGHSRSLLAVEVNSIYWNAEDGRSDHCSIDLFAPVSLVDRIPFGLLRLLEILDGPLAMLVCPDGS